MTNEIKRNESNPKIEISWRDLATPAINFSQKYNRGLLWLADKIQNAAKHRIMTHGPLAAITYPIALALHEIKNALIGVTGAGLSMGSNICSGAVGGIFYSLTSLMKNNVPPSSEAFTLLASNTVIGGALGSLAVPIVFSALLGIGKIIKQAPNIIANSATGFKRSCDFILGLKNEPAPVIINPVPNRGVEPLTLPAPSALIKLAGSSNKAFAVQTKAPEQERVSAENEGHHTRLKSSFPLNGRDI